MRSTPVAIVAVPAVVAGAVVAAALAVAGSPAVLVLGLALAVALLVAGVLWLRAPKTALRALRARPMGRGEHPRLDNLVEGLCTTHGLSEPVLHVVDTPAINAASVGLGRAPAHLVVTRGALSGLDRLELEAVVARELCEMRRGLVDATVVASVARLPAATALTARLLRRGRGERAVTEADVEAVRLTSYPPALVSALEKAAEAPSVESTPAVAHLWLLAPTKAPSAARLQPPVVQRLDVLKEV